LGAFFVEKKEMPPKRPPNMLAYSISNRILTDNKKRKSPDFSRLYG